MSEGGAELTAEWRRVSAGDGAWDGALRGYAEDLAHFHLGDRYEGGAFSDGTGGMFLVGGRNRSSLDVAQFRTEERPSNKRRRKSLTCATATTTRTTTVRFERERLDVGDEENQPQNPRWAFAHCYCEREKVFFMHGGNDQVFCYSGTTFYTSPAGSSLLAGDKDDSRAPFPTTTLSPAIRSPRLSTLCSSLHGPSPRGHHTAVYVPYVASKGKRVVSSSSSRSSSVYLFGGYHAGRFMNDVHRLDLGTMEWTRVETSAAPAASAAELAASEPTPRAQSLGFHYRGGVYIFGGMDGGNIFNDLYKLELPSHTWHRVKTHGSEPLGLSGLAPNPHVAQLHPCQPRGLVLGHQLLLLAERHDTATYALYALSLRSWTWTRVRGTSRALEEDSFRKSGLLPASLPFEPPARGSPSLVANSAGSLYVLGGQERKQGRFGRQEVPPVWQIQLPARMDWPRERLLWLACYKNDRGECNLAKCPPHVMYHIIGYVNSGTFAVSRPCSH